MATAAIPRVPMPPTLRTSSTSSHHCSDWMARTSPGGSDSPSTAESPCSPSHHPSTHPHSAVCRSQMRVAIPPDFFTHSPSPLLPSPPPSVPPNAAAPSPIPPLPSLRTPRIDSLLASHRRARHPKPRSPDTELLHVLHVESRLEAVETQLHLASLGQQSSHPSHSLTLSPKKRLLHRPVRRVVTGRRGSIGREKGRPSIQAKVEQLTQQHEEVNAQINQVSASRRPQEGGPPTSSPGTEDTHVGEVEEPAKSAVKAFAEEAPTSTYQPAVSSTVVISLKQQLADVEAALATERAHRAEERIEAEQRIHSASEAAKQMRMEFEAHTALTSKQVREAEEQHRHALSVAVREARDSREAIDRLERDLRVMEEKMRRSDVAIQRDVADEERRWSERQHRLERQLADAESNEKRMRAELSRQDEDCEQMRRSLQSIQQQLSQSQEAERRCNTQLDGLTADVVRLRQSAQAAEELHRKERDDHFTAMRQMQAEREKDKAEWLEERQKLVRVSEEMEQRLSALHRHYLQRQQDVNDLKELLKLSVRKEREAASEAERCRLEAMEAGRVGEEWKRRWEKESREWEVQRSSLLQHQALQGDAEQQLVAEVTEKLRRSDEAALRLRSENSQLHQRVDELQQRVLTFVDPQLVEKLRDELAVQRKVGEGQAELVRSLQAQLVQVKWTAEQNQQRDGDSIRQVAYLTQQREELQQKLGDLLLQQRHWQDQQEQWREKEKQRKNAAAMLEEQRERNLRLERQLAAKGEALDYVEVEVRELKSSFEHKEREHERAVEALTGQLRQSSAEVTSVRAEVEALERERREAVGKAAQSESQVLRVEAEMRQLLQEMARRQQLAMNQLAHTLSMSMQANT